ncbi:hypothetical protein MY10362_002836 [Beauveria mimosiformis]
MRFYIILGLAAMAMAAVRGERTGSDDEIPDDDTPDDDIPDDDTPDDDTPDDDIPGDDTPDDDIPGDDPPEDDTPGDDPPGDVEGAKEATNWSAKFGAELAVAVLQVSKSGAADGSIVPII